MAVYIDPYNRPSRGAAYADVISNLIGSVQDRQQKEQDAQSKQEDAQNVAIAKQFLALPGDVQKQYYDNLPDKVKAYIINPSTLPAHTPTDSEAAAANYDKFLAGASTDFSAPANYDPSKVALFNDKVAGSKPLFDYQGRRFNYQNTGALPANVNTAQQTEDKLIPTGQEAFTNQNVTQPETAATIALRRAQANEQNAAAGNQSAQANEHNVKAKAASLYLPDSDTGQPSPAVQNAINAIRAGVQRGISVDAMTKRIQDPNLKRAVSAEMTKPQNQDIASSLPPLTAKGQNALTEIKPAEQNIDEILSALQPYKDDNTHGLRWAHLKYTLGFGSDPSTLESKISQFNLASIESMMPFASKSRAYQYIKDIGKHTLHTEKDTFQQMYEKAQNIKQNFQKMRDAVNRYERVGATGEGDNPTSPAPDNSNPLGLTPPQ